MLTTPRTWTKSFLQWKEFQVFVTSFSARTDDEEQTRISLNYSQQALVQVVAFLSQNSQLYQTEILSLEKPLLLHTGMGWLCTLDEPVSLATMIERIKRHLNCHIFTSWGRENLSILSQSCGSVCWFWEQCSAGDRSQPLPHRWDVPSWHFRCCFPRNKCYPLWT